MAVAGAGGTAASPSTRANDALLLCNCSSQIRMVSIGPISCRRYSMAAATVPSVTRPSK